MEMAKGIEPGHRASTMDVKDVTPALPEVVADQYFFLTVMDSGLAGQGGGQIGAGVLRAPIECYEAARSDGARYPVPA